MSLAYRVRRLGCRLFGCYESAHYPGCHRCGVYIYDDSGLFVESPCHLVSLYWSVRYALVSLILRITQKRVCATCGKRYRRGGTATVSEYGTQQFWCSEACFESYVPF